MRPAAVDVAQDGDAPGPLSRVSALHVVGALAGGQREEAAAAHEEHDGAVDHAAVEGSREGGNLRARHVLTGIDGEEGHLLILVVVDVRLKLVHRHVVDVAGDEGVLRGDADDADLAYLTDERPVVLVVGERRAKEGAYRQVGRRDGHVLDGELFEQALACLVEVARIGDERQSLF